MNETLPFEVLEGHRYARLTTFRKNGEVVSTPVWFALVGGRAYAFTGLHSGKAKRIRDNPIVIMTSSDFSGRAKAEAASRLRPASWTQRKRTSQTGR